MKKIVLFGAGGHSKVVLETVMSTGLYEVVAIEDPKLIIGDKWLRGIPVISFNEAIKLGAGIVCIGENHIREKIAKEISHTDAGFDFVTVIHSKAIVSSSAKLGKGTVVFAGVIVNADSVVGDHVVLNTGAIIEHDCSISDYSFVAPNAVLGGNVKMEKFSFVGIGASINQGLSIGQNAQIGNGSAVVSSVAANELVYGNPAVTRKSRQPAQNFF